MQKIIKLALFFTFILGTFYSCQKDEELIPSETKIVSKTKKNTISSRNSTNFCNGYVPTFCERQSQNPAALLQSTEGGVNVKVGKEEFEFLPIELYDGSKGLVVKTGEEVLIVHNGENNYLSSKNSKIRLPKEIGSLLNLEYEVKITNDRLYGKLSIELGRPIGGKGGTKVIDITGIPTEGGPTVNVRECDYIFVTNVNMFIDEFMDSGDSQQPHIPGLIEDAFNSCDTYDMYTDTECNNCKDPRCVIDNLLSLENGLTNNQKEFLVANYLRATLDLTDEEFVEISEFQENRDFAMDLYDYGDDCDKLEKIKEVLNGDCSELIGKGSKNRNEFSDCMIAGIKASLISELNDKYDIDNPCDDPDVSSEDLISDAVNGLEFPSVSEIGALGEMKQVIITDLDDCPVFSCILEKLKQDHNDVFCDLLGELDGNQNYNIIISDSLFYNGDGLTTLNTKGNCINLYVRSDFCEADENTDYLDMVGTLIHEMIHANLYINFLGQDLNNNEEYKIAWKKYISENYHIEYSSQHELMVMEYLEYLAGVIADFDNNSFPDEYYMYFAYEGLEYFPNLFPESQIEKWKRYKFDIVLKNENLFECKD